VIVFRDVVKRYGAHIALDGLSLPVGGGEAVALLGPNGSGKTTTLKIAAGLIRPDSGEVAVGEPPRSPFDARARHALSFLPQRVSFPEALTGAEVVEFYRRIRGAAPERSREVLRFASLNGAGARPVGSYSGGMVQRLGLAVAMLPDAEILLLDEPTAALDPEGLAAFYALVERRREQGRTVLFTSHQVGDVEHVADRIVVIARGRLVAELTQSALRDRLAARGEIRVRLDQLPAGLLDAVREVAPGATCVRDEVVAPGGAAVRLAVIDLMRRSRVGIRSLAAEDGRLEDLYRELVAADAGSDAAGNGIETRGTGALPETDVQEEGRR
jgi:Cu-processing system ATP-binding protein